MSFDRIKNCLRGADLKLDNVGIEPDDMRDVVDVLKRYKVKYLHLKNNRIGVKGARALAEALKDNIRAIYMDLSCRNNIGDKGARALAEALKWNNTVSFLDLSSNNIGDSGAMALADALGTNYTLKQVNLGWNKIGDEGARALLRALEKNRALFELHLERNRIEDKSLEDHIFGLLERRRCGGVRDSRGGLHDSLSDCSLFRDSSSSENSEDDYSENTDANWNSVDRKFVRNDSFSSRLIEYSESENSEYSGFEEPKTGSSMTPSMYEIRNKVELLSRNTVTTIDLYDYGIDCEGARAIAGALRSNTSLKKLDLGFNQIEDEGATALANALKENTTLTELILEQNAIGYDGVRALAAALQVNTTLTKLDITNNPNYNKKSIGVKQEILTLVKRNREKAEERKAERKQRETRHKHSSRSPTREKTLPSTIEYTKPTMKQNILTWAKKGKERKAERKQRKAKPIMNEPNSDSEEFRRKRLQAAREGKTQVEAEKKIDSEGATASIIAPRDPSRSPTSPSKLGASGGGSAFGGSTTSSRGFGALAPVFGKAFGGGGSSSSTAKDEAKRKAKAEAEEAKRKAEAEAEAKLKAEAEAKQKAEAEAEAKRKAEAETKRKAEAEAKWKAEVEAKLKAEAEAKQKAEAEAEAKRKAEAETKWKAEIEAKLKAESEAKLKEAEAKWKAKAEAEAKRKAEAEVEAVPVIAPTECKVMISFNNGSAGEDAERLANYLTSNGHPTFCTRLYCHNHSGSWRNVTVAGANNCQYYLLLLTKGWQKSYECQFETEIAVNRKAKGEVDFIPVWYEDFDYNLDTKGETKGDSKHEAKYYSTMFLSIQSIYRKSDNWMQDILKLLQEGGEKGRTKPLPTPTSPTLLDP